MSDNPVSLAQIVAALSVTYTPVGVLIWLTSERRTGPRMTADFTITERVSTPTEEQTSRTAGDGA